MVEAKGGKRKAASSRAAAQPQAQRRALGKLTSKEAAVDRSPEQLEPEESEPEESEVTSSESYESTGDEGSEGGGDTSDEEESGADAEQVQTLFNFQDPREEHFHGLRSLLQNFLDGQEFDVSGLVDLILKQVHLNLSLLKQYPDSLQIHRRSSLRLWHAAQPPILPLNQAP